MIYFGIAALALLGLLMLSRARRRRGRGRSLFFALRHLKATTEQKEVIRAAASEMKQAAKRFASETRASRPELGAMMRDETFNEEGVRAWLAQRERTFDDFKPQLVASMHKIHAVLTPPQREQFSHLIEIGPVAFFGDQRRCRPSH